MGADYSKRVEGPTPSGGTYAEITFYDADGKRCRERAVYKIVINEYGKRGELLKSTYGYAKEK